MDINIKTKEQAKWKQLANLLKFININSSLKL
jgi:hypothetical protein